MSSFPLHAPRVAFRDSVGIVFQVHKLQERGDAALRFLFGQMIEFRKELQVLTSCQKSINRAFLRHITYESSNRIGFFDDVVSENSGRTTLSD